MPVKLLQQCIVVYVYLGSTLTTSPAHILSAAVKTNTQKWHLQLYIMLESR